MGQDVDSSGLDFDFLRYMGVRPETQRHIQEFYLPYFVGRQDIIDLGCGDGDFVRMLSEQGVNVVGVDSDEKARNAAEKHGYPIVQMDVFDYMRSVPNESVDGIFCAHLVEHLPYEQVVALVHLSCEALRPGGIILLATPDVRSLFSHLEMFYLHFGHVSFYHPRLLCFFLDHAGLAATEYGTNPRTASPMLGALSHLATSNSAAQVSYRREIPPQGESLLHRASYSLKRRLAQWLVQPFLDDLTENINLEMNRTRGDISAIATSLQSLDGPFECYALAYKPSPVASSDDSLTAPR